MQLRQNILVVSACVVGLCAALPCGAQQDSNETIRTLLVEAIRKGKAHGEMGGQVRESFARLFGTDAPILVDVERLEALAMPGCYRLRVTTTQAGVYEFDPKTKVRNATPSNKMLDYKVSYCANGHFPEEGGGR